MGVRVQTLLLFSSYLVSVAVARYNKSGLEQAMLSRSIRAATAICFGLLSFILYTSGGSFDVWPNVLPLSLIFALMSGLSILFVDPLVAKVTSKAFQDSYQNISWTAAMLTFISTSYYVMLPPESGWMRPTGLLSFICMALPLIFGLGYLNKDLPERELTKKAFEAAYAVYNKTRTPTFVDTEFVHNQETGARAGISTTGTDVFIAFSGSKSKTDWLKTNTDASTAKYGGEDSKMYVHKGFLEAWKSISDEVIRLANDALMRTGGKGRVILTGHSLGGAQATLAALDIAEIHSNIIVITFGSPQVGTPSFVKTFNETIPSSYRIFTLFDPVVRAVATFEHVKGGKAITTPALDNPATAHSLDTYAAALSTPASAAIIPAGIIVGLLVMSACVPKQSVEELARHVVRLNRSK